MSVTKLMSLRRDLLNEEMILFTTKKPESVKKQRRESGKVRLSEIQPATLFK